jgi:hypothetical protein
MSNGRGCLQKGPDKRRHKFTKDKCRRGYRAARAKLFRVWDCVDWPAWLAWKVKGFYMRRQ